ncbi:MAG: leucine-rich repeat protein [Muribaculaceae bacterium]|nr:leucine-rich repeat protein [Muribaculaceae bacterium]
MKRLTFLVLLTIIIVIPTVARTFSYKYEGQTLTYNVLDEDERTVETKGNNYNAQYKGDLIIPAIVKDGGKEYTVVKIAQQSFYNCSGLTSVEIPNTVDTIGVGAFRFCGLKSVTLGKSVSTIERQAFWYCKQLESVVFPQSVTSIEHDAFIYCSSLKKLVFEDGNEEVQFDHPGAWIDAKLPFHGCPVQYIYLGRNFNYKWIEDSPFAGISTLESVEIGDNVTYLAGGLFRECNGLKNVIWGASVRSVGNYTFDKCTALTEVIMPNSVIAVYEYAFSECTGIETLKLSASLRSIGISAFSNCSGLTSLELPASLTSIGEKAFYSCENITELRIPNRITKIEPQTFANNRLKKLSIGHGVKTIASGAFSSKIVGGVLEQLVIGSSVTSIEGGALNVSSTGTVFSYAIEPPAVTLSSFGMNQFSNKLPLLYVTGNAIQKYKSDNNWPLIFKSIEEFSIPVQSIRLSTEEWAGKVGESFNIAVYANPGNTTDRTIIWNSSDSSVASVDKNGNVTAVSVGSAVITATVGRVSATCEVIVTSAAINNITLNYSDVTLSPSETIQLVATLSPEDITDKAINWTSDNENVAIVNEDGLVTALSEGMATISASCDDKTATCTITVIDTVSGIGSLINDTGESDTIDTTSHLDIYDLNGVLISDTTDNLAPGTYIVRQGAKVMKLVVR